MAKHKQPFCLEGRFNGFMAGGKSPFKYLSLHGADGQYVVKLPKSVRLMLFRYLQTDDLVRVIGHQSIDQETGELQFKAQEVVRIKTLTTTSSEGSVHASPPSSKPSTAKRNKAKVLICQKSACRKRGAEGICRAIDAALEANGLADTVQVKLTGCMDKCKAGPNVVVMPAKQRYTRVRPGQIPDLVSQHFQQDQMNKPCSS